MRQRYASHDPVNKEISNVKSFLTRRRKWKLMLQMFGSGIDFEMTGIFLNINKKGYVYRAVKLSVSRSFGLQENITFESRDTFRTSIQYIWSSQGRCVTLGNKKRGNSPKKKRWKKLNDGKKIKENEFDTAKGSNDVPIMSNQNDSGYSESDSEDEDSSDEYDETTKWLPPPRKVSRNLRYLYSDVYVEKKHSKKRSFHMKNYLEDIIVTPRTKSRFCGQKAETFRLHSANDAMDVTNCQENDELADFTAPPLILGKFLTLGSETRLETPNSSQHLSPPHNNTETEDDSLHMVIFRQEIINCEDKTNISNEDENETAADKSLIDLSKEVPVLDLESVQGGAGESSWTTREIIDPIGSTSIDNDEGSFNESKNQDFPNVILLSRNLTRPDILRKDFKLNYKEAQCKPRRFLVNISHLAYQHFVLKGIVPLQVIPKLDLSLYLVFTFVREITDNVDEYRIVINTNLHLRNMKDILVPICTGKVISIHEVMQRTIAALDFIDVSQIQYKISSDLADNMDYKATHSFNLLTSALKWNIRIFDHPHAIEWAEDLNSQGFMALHESNSNELSLVQVIGNEAISSELARDNHASKKGPHRPSICGICLQDFTEDRFSFPMALCVCSHWFCEICWKANCHMALNKDDQNFHLTCLENGCTSPMDPASLLSLLPLQMVRHYESQRLKDAIENTAFTRLCSNPVCRKIICAKHPTINNVNQTINVTCSCYHQMCLFCSLPPHWPLKCVEAKIYQRRLHALQHDKSKLVLEDSELPDIVLRGRPCPSCGEINQANFQFSGAKTCSCGNVFCWMCGKDLSYSQELHISCTQQFQNEDKKLKQRLIRQDRYSIQNGESIQWYKVALRHRQLQHPQVVTMLYKMADTLADAMGEMAGKGKPAGNIRQVAFGWKNSLRKFAETKFKILQEDQSFHPTSVMKSCRVECHASTLDSGVDRLGADGPDSPRSISSLSSTESLPTDRRGFGGSPVPRSSVSKTDPLLKKAILNIVNTKLELHHVIEHLAVFLEYSHTLNEPEKVRRSLERAEDLCTCLDMLLQPTHAQGCARILSSFLRLRMQISNVLTTIQNNLRHN